MCLSIVYHDERMLEEIECMTEEIPGVVRVWKVVRRKMMAFPRPAEISLYNPDPPESDLKLPYTRYCWVALNYPSQLLEGYREASLGFCHCQKQHAKYWTGFHGFLNPYQAFGVWASCKRFKKADGKFLISLLIEKNWITAVGEQGSTLIVVSSAIFGPTYPYTEARIEDYLAWRKQHQSTRPDYTVVCNKQNLVTV